jgi:hypothetical protein
MKTNLLFTIVGSLASTTWTLVKNAANKVVKFVSNKAQQIKEAAIELVANVLDNKSNDAVEGIEVVVVDETMPSEPTEEGGTTSVVDKLITAVAIIASMYLVYNLPITILLITEVYLTTKALIYCLDYVTIKE